MKRILFYFFLCGIVFVQTGCKKNKLENQHPDAGLTSDPSKMVNNITDPNDPNLSAGWQWTPYVSHKLYYSPNGSTTNIQTVDTFLPFYTQGNVLNTGAELDIYPEDGWVLAFRDFGTPVRPVDFPFFCII